MAQAMGVPPADPEVDYLKKYYERASAKRRS